MNQKLNINELWIAFGSGTSLRYLAVHEIVSRLGPEKARSLPVFHAFTGCDTVSCFSEKGKMTAWITYIVAHPYHTSFWSQNRDQQLFCNEIINSIRVFILFYL